MRAAVFGRRKTGRHALPVFRRAPERGYSRDKDRCRGASTVTADGATTPFTDVVRAGRVGDSDLYEAEHVMTVGHARSHQFYFLRNEIAYVVTLKAAADASGGESAELDAVRKSMGL